MRYLAVLFGMLAAIAVAGCGGGSGGSGGEQPLSKADYEQRMQAVAQDAASTFEGLGSPSDDLSDVEAIAADLNAAADVLEAQSRSLDEIVPPEDVADSHRTMVDASGAAANGLRAVADDGASVEDSLGAFDMREFAELEDAVSEIRAKGYDIGDGW